MASEPSKNRGFTLIELLVTISIAAILLTVAVPNFIAFVMNSRMASQANDLIATLSFARSEAVKTGANVAVCVSSTNACPAQAAGATAWASGWIVRDAAGTVLRRQQALSGTSTLVGNWNSVTYNANGQLGGMPVPTATITFTLCPPAPAQVQGRSVQIVLTGRASVSSVACP
jgi:type IV fimbrial biogenesis protein FimT